MYHKTDFASKIANSLFKLYTHIRNKDTKNMCGC